MLEILVFQGNPLHEKLAPMSIHDQIKRRREAREWSQQRLAEEVSKLEGRAKPLAWQTVQQWENGASAPKRERLGHVAAALGSTVEELLDGEPPAAVGASTSAPLSEGLLQALLSDPVKAALVENIARAALGMAPLPGKQNILEKVLGPAATDEQVEARMPITRTLKKRHGDSGPDSGLTPWQD